MRDILFRGVADVEDYSDKWIYGGFIQKIKKDGSYTYCIRTPFNIEYEVDGNTVGEFTGIYDKNGKEIFEGDILRDNIGLIYAIVWNTKHLWFEGKGNGFEVLSNIMSKSVVIGNIYDNPKLIEVENYEY